MNHENILEEIYSMVDGNALAASSRVSKSWHRVLDRLLKKKRILSFVAIYDGDGTAWTLFLNKRPETILYLEVILINRSSRRERGMAPNQHFIIPVDMVTTMDFCTGFSFS